MDLIHLARSDIGNARMVEMATFDKLRYLFERIMRERAFEPAQLDGLLSTQFTKMPDSLPNHFHYHALLTDDDILQSCDLRYPKSEAAKNAVLTVEAGNRQITPSDIHKAYGESVRSIPGRKSANSENENYLSVMFDHAELLFGFDQKQKVLCSVIVEFDLGRNA